MSKFPKGLVLINVSNVSIVLIFLSRPSLICLARLLEVKGAEQCGQTSFLAPGTLGPGLPCRVEVEGPRPRWPAGRSPRLPPPPPNALVLDSPAAEGGEEGGEAGEGEGGGERWAGAGEGGAVSWLGSGES
jgi:hypothetical protein